MVLTGQDIEDMVAGDNCDIEIEVNNPDGTDVNLTGATIDWYLKESADSLTAIIHKTTPTDIVITDPTHGLCVVHLDPADTTAILPNKYFHGAKITNGGDIYTVTTGYMTILPKLG
jgi:hypothetical protein